MYKRQAHIYPGRLLRCEAETDSPLAKIIRPHLEAGTMVPAEIVLQLIEKEIEHAPKGYALDGFPRDMEQALGLESLLQERNKTLDAVISLHLDEPEIYRRLLERGRSDDKPEIIARRIELYHCETDPVLQRYEKKGLLMSVSAEGSIEQVTERILSALHSKPPCPGDAPVCS